MPDVGAEAAHRYRERMQAKARRLGEGKDAVSVDASSFTPGEPLDADAKTGMRPVSRQARAAGGVVTGRCAGGRADRAPRKAGGGVGESIVNRNAKQANADREGRKHDMGLQSGGRARRAGGGGLGALGGLLPLAISEMSGGDSDPNKNQSLTPAAPRANGGGINTDSGVFKPDKERPGASFTRRAKQETGSSAVETRLGRASGGRVAKADGGPLSTPLAAGMGGQGRMNFNFAPNRAQMLKDGGRTKAHKRYGSAGPAEQHPGLKRAYGGDAYGRSPENRQFQDDAAETLGDAPRRVRAPPSAATLAEIERIKKSMRAGRAEGGKVAEGALKQHQAEHKAMGAHGPGCDCERCTHKRAKGGILKQFDAERRAEGGAVKRARGGKTGKGTKINIIIAPGGMNPQQPPPGGGLPPNLAIRPPPAAAPMPMPGGAPPPGAAPPMPMPIPVPMGGAGMPSPGMPPRARGGRAPKMEAGAGSGLGRLEKIRKYGERSREGSGLRK